MPYAVAVRVLLLALPLLLGTAPPLAETGGGWSAAPSGGGRPSFYAEGTPGTVLQDTVAVTNPDDHPLAVRLSGTGPPLVFADPAPRVPARTRAEIPFTVTVPADAAPGDRTGSVVVRDAQGREATVRLLLRVGGPKLAALSVEQAAVGADGITYTLVNRGTTALAPHLAVRADGVLGPVLDRAERPLPVIVPPGGRLRLTEPWPDRPVLDAVTVRLTVTAPGGARATADASATFVPWGAVAGTAAGAAALVGAAASLRRRGRRRRGTDRAPAHAMLTGPPAPPGPPGPPGPTEPSVPGPPAPTTPTSPQEPSAPAGPLRPAPAPTGAPK